MEIRDLLEKYPRSLAIAVLGLIVVLSVFCYRQIRSGGRPPLPLFPGSRVYFTTDDGATLFVDSATRIPPFDHGGQPAVRAYVFTTEQGDRRWVQYLEKLSDEGAEQLAAFRSNPMGGAKPPSDETCLVKKPGEGQWVPRTDRAAAQIMIRRTGRSGL